MAGGIGVPGSAACPRRAWGQFPRQHQTPFSRAGSASRRCLLSPHGVAYWGVPSFARCVSHEYRYLHLSVGARSGAALPSPSPGVCSVPSPCRPLQGRETQQLPCFIGSPCGETEAGLPG